MKFEDLIINKNSTIAHAMEIIDKTEKKTIFVIDDNDKFVGLVNDGDIRRALIRGISDKESVIKITNLDPIADIKTAKERINKLPVQSIPVPILKDGKLVDCTVVTKDLNSSFMTTHNKHNRVLVIGGAGYLGSVLCRKLLNKGYRVRVLDCLLYGDEGLRGLYSNPSFEFNYGDMRNLETLVSSMKDVDAVIHLSAIVGDPASEINPKTTIESNYFSTGMIADVCKYYHINKLIFASTCSVYGASKNKGMLNEKSETNPVSLYAELKLKSEEALYDRKNGSFRPIIFRMGTLHGVSPRMRFDLVINILSIKAMVDNEITIFGGDQSRAFCSVSDAADAYIKALEIKNSEISDTIYNLVSENLSINSVGEMVHNITGANIVRTEVDDQRDYIVSGQKAVEVFDLEFNNKILSSITSIKENSEKYKNYVDKKYSNVKFLKAK